MEESEVLAYVKAAARAVNLPLDEARAHAVATQLGRTAAMARLFDGVDMEPEDEPAEIYQSGAFSRGGPQMSSAAAIIESVATGQASACEVLESAIARIEATDGRVNAFTETDAASARAPKPPPSMPGAPAARRCRRSPACPTR